MERYFKRKTAPESVLSSSLKRHGNSSKENVVDMELSSPLNSNDCHLKESVEEINLADLPADPGLRTGILNYNPNVRDQIRRYYLQKGPCQPRDHTFPQTMLANKLRRFNPAWFEQYPTWLEYSIAKDKAYCLCCYLFKVENGSKGESFVSKGFSNWKKKDRLQIHVGGPSSPHNSAWQNCEALLNQNQHIETIFFKQSNEARKDYRLRLGASINCVRLLLQLGLPFRGHDESEESNRRGNFLEILQWLGNIVQDIKAVTMENAPANQKMVSSDIQKDIASAISFEIINSIVSEIGDAPFTILVDESRDISSKEQMAIVLRYVDKGRVIERFVGIEHVTSTTALSLKTAIDGFFSRHGLSISRLRGQGYDGASNMQGEFNGLKTLILKENECAYSVHCFAHQLQLAVVAVAKKQVRIEDLFTLVSSVVNIVGGSAKRCDVLRDKQAEVVLEALKNGELSSGRGLNQETNLKRSGDTRWGSHYNTLISLSNMFESVTAVLEMIADDGSKSDNRLDARILRMSIRSFDFIFSLHLMKNIMGITNDLSLALQRKDQDIVNAMNLVKICKQRLQQMRDCGWDSLLIKVSSFCERHEVDIPDMEGLFIPEGKSKRKAREITNLHYYRVELFYAVLDMQLQELSNRFTETNTELLLCVACLNPIDAFSSFDKERLIRLAQFYPKDFSDVELAVLEDTLETYILDMRSHNGFVELRGIAELAEKMVETKKDKVYPLVYSLLTLALLLPVATATVERVFSAMNIVKTRLRNRMGDEWMNDNLLAYVENDVFETIDNEIIMQRFQKMKTRRGQL